MIQNTSDLEGVHFARFDEPALAINAWRDALVRGEVQPLPPLDANTTSRNAPSNIGLYHDSSVEVTAQPSVTNADQPPKSQVNRLLELLADTAYEGPGRIYSLADFEQFRWHHNSTNTQGAKWVVLKGRKVGIFNTW